MIAEALLDYVRAARRGCLCSDGLFLVIVRRRACDFWRGHANELPLKAASSVACKPNDGPLLERTLRDRLLRLSTARSPLHRRRLLAITSRIFEGATFAEACRASGIPRGSHGRYRKSLQDVLALRRERGAGAQSRERR